MAAFAELKGTLEAVPKPARRPRRPSVRKLITDAEKAGKSVASVTLPDGTVLKFGEPEPSETNNPWLDDLRGMRKQ